MKKELAESPCMFRMIVTTIAVFGPGYSAEDGIDRLARLGFEGLDMPFDYWANDPSSPFLNDNYLLWAENLRARAENAGVTFWQAHAPLDEKREYIEKAIRAAGALGAHFLVIHPTYRTDEGFIIDRDTFLNVNTAEIRQWLPLAEKCGVKLLSENVLWGASSDPRILADLVSKVDSEWFGWCFDTGHAHLCGYAQSVLTECVATPLSLHIQDGDGQGDMHWIPGDGTIDWSAFCDALVKVGYRGACVLEAHHQSMDAPDSERDTILRRLLTQAADLSKSICCKTSCVGNNS